MANVLAELHSARLAATLERVQFGLYALALAVAAVTCRIIGALRVKNETDHICEAIQSILPMCEQVFVFDDHSEDDTVRLARACDARVSVMISPFEGTDEVRDKNYVLDALIQINPEWVLWIDGDEVLERSGPATLLELSSDPRIALASLKIAYLWDDPNQVRIDGIFGAFRRRSFFRLRGQHHLRFRPSGAGGGFHCGNVPQRIRDGEERALDVRLKHYGYLNAEQRQRKYEWYNALDPNNASEDCYRHLIGIPGARYAPGPPRFEPWTE